MKRCCVFSIIFGGLILAGVNVLFNPFNFIYGEDVQAQQESKEDLKSESEIDLQAELEKGKMWNVEM